MRIMHFLNYNTTLNSPLPLRRLFVDLKRLSDPALREHLQLDAPSEPELSISTFPYESVYTELQAICAALGPKDRVWICDKASCALTQVIPKVSENHTDGQIGFSLFIHGGHAPHVSAVSSHYYIHTYTLPLKSLGSFRKEKNRFRKFPYFSKKSNVFFSMKIT